ncbi:MAG: 2-C-methyl-D-erythritol 2,4-cyclodiphosphate synthase [Candidatus Daviesbacteria bacterium]|nr:2-C-methyl-D-erythritol 2,4-cyclodiphosphate synthase [Candidatus Daviesbacteria bacterium]
MGELDKLYIGQGSDVHKLVEGRKLILVGMEIPSSVGPIGHSDGDVLAHAIGDAMLGAAKLGDIGRFFPDNNPEFKDLSGMVLLERVREIIKEAGFRLIDLDSTVKLKSPRLLLFMPQMQINLSSSLQIPLNHLNIKAGTDNGVGEVGRGLAISAEAIALMYKE